MVFAVRFYRPAVVGLVPVCATHLFSKGRQTMPPWVLYQTLTALPLVRKPVQDWDQWTIHAATEKLSVYTAQVKPQNIDPNILKTSKRFTGCIIRLMV